MRLATSRIEALHFRGGLKRARLFGGFFTGRGFRFIGAGARIACSLLGAFVCRLFFGQALGDLRLEFVELGVARADEVQVLPFERAQFRAQFAERSSRSASSDSSAACSSRLRASSWSSV